MSLFYFIQDEILHLFEEKNCILSSLENLSIFIFFDEKSDQFKIYQDLLTPLHFIIYTLVPIKPALLNVIGVADYQLTFLSLSRTLVPAYKVISVIL